VTMKLNQVLMQQPLRLLLLLPLVKALPSCRCSRQCLNLKPNSKNNRKPRNNINSNKPNKSSNLSNSSNNNPNNIFNLICFLLVHWILNNIKYLPKHNKVLKSMLSTLLWFSIQLQLNSILHLLLLLLNNSDNHNNLYKTS